MTSRDIGEFEVREVDGSGLVWLAYRANSINLVLSRCEDEELFLNASGCFEGPQARQDNGGDGMIGLNPCPFCGADGRVSQLGGGRFIVSCTGCCMRTRDTDTEEDAVEIWNRRQ